MDKIKELELRLALVSDELINTQAELDNERQYQVSMEYLWGLDRELLSNLKEHNEKVEHERDEALNQLDSAKHSIVVLEKRVLQVMKQRDASLILNEFYKEDRKQTTYRIEELTECNEQFSVDNAFLKKRAEGTEAKLTKVLKAQVKAAFEEGFLAGTEDGWVNNPRIEVEWKHSKAIENAVAQAMQTLKETK